MQMETKLIDWFTPLVLTVTTTVYMFVKFTGQHARFELDNQNVLLFVL